MTIYNRDYIIAFKNQNKYSYIHAFKNQLPDFYSYINDLQTRGTKWSQKLYNWLYPEKNIPCKICGRWENKFRDFYDGYHLICSRSCQKEWQYTDECKEKKQLSDEKNQLRIAKMKETIDNKTPEEKIVSRMKREATCLEKYGATNPAKNTTIQKKITNTTLAKYGVTHSSKDKTIRKKKIDTNMKKFGVPFPMMNAEVRETRRANNLKRYGVKNISQLPTTREKVKNTNLSKYGVEYVSQNREIHEKAMRRRCKTYTFPSGNMYKVQGYEPVALDKLLAEGYTESQIQLTNRPSIKYFWSSSDGYGDDKWHIYHPDIFLPEENRLIEVKSSWTYDGCGKNKKLLSNNLAKKEGAILAGYSFDFMIF
jgi:hypothetical protein